MALASSALSRTLQSITAIKISELEKQRKSFEVRKGEVYAAVKNVGGDHYSQGCRLLAGVKELDPSSESEPTIYNFQNSLYQSFYDSSITAETLKGIGEHLRSRLDAKSQRLSLADLYSRLLTEWLVSSASSDNGPTPAMQEIASLEDSFEIIERDRLQQLRSKFAEVVFTPLETDEVEIDNYLSGLFKEEAGIRALERLRLEVKVNGEKAFKHTDPFNGRSIKWCIKGLLSNDLLNEDKKVILQDFLQDEVALGEICDVLNMKYKDLKNWEWEAADTGMPVEPRRQLNGKYRVMMDEDVLQALLIHYIGMTWSVAMKQTLTSIMRYGSIWTHHIGLPQGEKDKRQYYLGKYHAQQENQGHSVARDRQDTYANDFFLSQLPTTVYEGAGGYDGDQDEELEESKRKSPKEIMQQLLRQLATEIHMHRTLNEKVAIVQSDLQWFATSLPHSTVFAVLRFVGVPEEWLEFFKKFLETPLNMGPVSLDSGETPKVQIRKRGVPMAHSLEKFFGEVVLFFMDLAVNQEAKMLLYRFHDDLWLVGDPEKCARAWKIMETFSGIMGLKFNKRKTGSVYLTYGNSKDESVAAVLPEGTVSMGFLKLDDITGEWNIDDEEVGKHINQLQKQLSSCTSVLAWVQTWNSCIGRFFSHTFGEPANCFGRKHLESILKTHQNMQKLLFDGKGGNGTTVTEHIKGLIAKKFNVTDVPDAFIYMPEQFGGLGVRNPFALLFMMRDQLTENPKQIMKTYLDDEKSSYKSSRKDFEELSEQARRRRFRDLYPTDGFEAQTVLPCWGEGNDLNTFMNFSDFTRYREAASPALLRAYRELLQVPSKKDVLYTRDVKDALRKLAVASGQPDLAPEKLDPEEKWLVQFHSKELFERCGGLSIVDRSLLPLGILTMLKKRKVSWQMVL